MNQMKIDGSSADRDWQAVLFRGAWLYLFAALTIISASSAHAQDAAEQNALFQRMVQNPANHDVTFEYARVATARGDYEAAIGALERLLYYNPRLTRVKYEIGVLYFRLGSYAMARRYFNEALQSPDLSQTTRQRIETYLPDAEKQLQNSRLSGFVQTGVRYQSNGNYVPIDNTLRLGGTDLTLLPTAQKRSDVNAFELAGISHDYDLGTGGNVLETRFSGYLTQQARLSQLDVGLFDISIGPRLLLAPDVLPGVTIKPYVVGGNTWVDNTSYYSSGGAGLSMRIPVNERFTFGPEFEWRRLDYKNIALTTVSPFGSSDSYTGGVVAGFKLTQLIKLDLRGLYRRGEANQIYQSFDQWAVEAALTFEFAPPFASMSRNWSVAPFVKHIDTQFGAANPFIDPLTVQHDRQWSAGVIFNTPLTSFNAPFNGTFGWTSSLQYDHTSSSLPNYRLTNFSVMSGPTVRF
jgi:hypothetical protein